MQKSQGMMLELDSVALQYLMFGHRIAFMDFFSGEMFVGIGVRGIRHMIESDWNKMYPLVERVMASPWDLSKYENRELLRDLVRTVDPAILHVAPPRDVVE